MKMRRKQILPEPALPDAREILERGRTLARDWRVGPSPFLKAAGVGSEAAYKRARAAQGRIMQHAQIGFRDPVKSKRAYAEIYETCQRHGVTVDRYGICLDWSMGYPRHSRNIDLQGTGLVLDGPEAFADLASAAPVAPHFGDFVMGFPAAVENTQAALAAGATSVGNLGQYFTFRLPNWDDDVATTEATLTALGLIAAQDVEVLVHSNLDDGFAAMFTDLTSSLGAVLIERHIVENLIGARLSHCFGNHFSDPFTRSAFLLALGRTTDTPGTMVYGNTVSYRGTAAQNFASLANYLLADVLTLRTRHTGHAINPVPITENLRIPDIDEIVDAQLFAARLSEHAADYDGLVDMADAGAVADEILQGAARFKDNVLEGLRNADIDTDNPFEMLLALKRIGGKRLEEYFGAGVLDGDAPRGRKPVVAASLLEEIGTMAQGELAVVDAARRDALAKLRLRVLVATTDVHEHGKLLVEQVFKELSVTTLDGGVAADADDLAALALETGADAIALSTYNGVALSYLTALFQELKKSGVKVPVLIGGRLNEIPAGSNTSLPVDVSDRLSDAGAIICRRPADAVPALLHAAAQRNTKGAAP